MSNVTKISPALNGLVEAIKKAVYEHAGQISLGSTPSPPKGQQ